MVLEAPPLGVGTLVRVRQRTFLVESVRTAPGAASVVALACVDDDAQGRRLEVIWDAEVDARIIPAGRSAIQPNPRPDDPKRFAAYLHALRWGCVTSTDPTLFQAPLRAGIIPKSYQLEPLRKALALPRVNLFIADDVGVGKTIEAGLVLQELLLRQRVHRVLIAAPASVVLQWRDELSQRFGLSFAVLDKAYVNARRRERGFGVNPWTTHRHFLISHNLLRDEDYLVGLRDWLGDFCPGSLFILDEAHVAAPASESKYAIDSQTTRSVRDVARRFEHRLFLSATPHNGHSNSFSALLEILDPQRFTRGVPVKSAAALRPVMVRRLKAELRGHIESPIPERVVEAIEIDHLPASAPELALSAMLAEYSDILERRLANGGKRTRSAGKLVALALQKRLLSSIEAFAHTLAVHRRTQEEPQRHEDAKKENNPIFESLRLRASSPSDEDEDLEDAQVSELEDVEVARATKAGASATDDARARQLIEEMSAIAAEARGQPDAKVMALLAWIRKHQCSEKGAWLPRRILIFTEYVDTKTYLVAQLEAALAKTERADERILTIHGGMDEEAREAVKQAFNDERHPVRILIGTDAAREGLNLQAQCADLFHFDLPWNPGRMEQRNGRIDRILQPQETVYCRYFVYAQRPEDAVLSALVKKSERIRKQLGSLADILAHKLEATLQDGIKRGSARELVSKLDAADPEELRGPVAANELEQARDADKELREQLAELARLDQKAAQHLDLRPDRLCDVVNVGLGLAGQPPLIERAGSPGVFDVPALDKLAGADGTWRDIMDTLRRPRTRKMPEWEWRAKSPPRPVSFAPSTTLSSDNVQLHLQHKLTQRALAQFRSQAFGEDKLSRVTVLIDPDPNYRQKRILALGRLSLYGDGAARLHEEILAVAALWEEGDDPARLQPFKTSEAEEKALESLYAILAKDSPPSVSKHTVDKVMAHAVRDEEALWETLEKKSLRRAIWAAEKLRQRAKVEAEEMQRILDAQRVAIAKELEARRQLMLPWTTEEQEQKKQHEADTRYIEKRRGDLDRELESEPQRIRDQYEVKHRRLERVGLVYLWPVTA